VHILVVEDDALLAVGLERVLTRTGYAVDHAATGKYADRMLIQEEFGLVILDVGLPDLDGFELLRRLRSRRSAAKILVLTARDAVEDRVRGLDLGADDYLTKPFSVSEFEARVRALTRRAMAPTTRWSAAGITIDVAAKRIHIGDQPVELTPREWALFELFLASPGRVLSKDQIAENLTTIDDQLSSNAIEVHVSRLRSKLELSKLNIRTVRGFGYLCEIGDA